MDFDNDDRMLTNNERLAKQKKKHDVRKILSKQK
jgi:hypothetical protein